MKCPKWLKWLFSHFEGGVITDFPNAPETDPNEPLRTMEPRKVKGGKFKFKI